MQQGSYNASVDTCPGATPSTAERFPPPAVACGCPVCGGPLMEIRHKLHCQRCHAIVETCCEGGRG
jgi:hypothetical protein